MGGGFIILLAVLAVWWALSRLGRRPASIREAPACSFLAYGHDGKVEYVEDVSDGDAEECAADRLCEAGGCSRVEHKFSDGSVKVYTPDEIRRLGW